MLGGVWEWTSSLYRNYPFPDDGRNNPEGKLMRAGEILLKAVVLLAVLAVARVGHMQTGGPAVNISTVVRGGVVVVSYDLVSNNPTAEFSIVLEASSDGGKTYNVRPRTLKGDVGPAVRAGMGKQIIWEAAQDVENLEVDRYRYRVVAQPVQARPGDVFRDCADCPEMVVIPAGEFTMGSPPNEDEGTYSEGPTGVVSVSSFALGRYEVTRAQFETYATDVGAQLSGCLSWNGSSASGWQSPGFEQTPSDPVVCVSWEDANAFTEWLGLRAKQAYRLASEAEWEYAARAGTTTRRYWGNSPLNACGYANVADETARKSFPTWTIHECADGFTFTAPAGRFRPNAFGLYDVLGNAWEWTQDCWNDNYTGAPTNSGPWTTGDCRLRVQRGGSFITSPPGVRSAMRGPIATAVRNTDAGFRVARALP